MIRPLVVWLIMGSTAIAAAPVRITLVDGNELTTDPARLSLDNETLKVGDRAVPLGDVRWITASAAGSITPATNNVQLWLVGGQLTAKDLVVEKDRVELRRPDAAARVLPLDAVRAVWWGPSPVPAAFTAAIMEPHRERDRFLLLVNGSPTMIDGFLEAVSADQVRLDWMDEVRNVARSVCLGFVTTQSAAPRSASPKYSVRLRDGSQIPVHRLSFKDDAIVCQVTDEVEWSLAWNEIERIGVATDRIKFLSDLTPVEVRAETIVALPRPWRADRSVTGRPLATPSDRGLGLPAGTWLTFDLGGLDAEQFAVELALDPVTGKTGDCEAVLRGDGRELARHRLRGGEQPISVRIPVGEIQRLELGVDPGQNLDLGDHVNFLDARLIRPTGEPGASATGAKDIEDK